MGEVCSRGYCLGPMGNEGEECGMHAWTSSCYGDSPMSQFPFGLGCVLYGQEGTPYAALSGFCGSGECAISDPACGG